MNILIISFILCANGYVDAYKTTVVRNSTWTDGTNFTTVQQMVNYGNDSSHKVPSSPETFASSVLSAFSAIAISELGDRTFFIAVVLALTHSQICVYLGVVSALALMTLLSAALGLFSAFIPVFWVQCLSATLFLIFGIKMLWEGYKMNTTAGKEEFEGVQKEMEAKNPSEEKSPEAESKLSKFKSCLFRWVFIEAFILTFLAEWGDRSQIATVLLAAKGSVPGVILGATLGHAICNLLAVIGGKIVAYKVSIKIVTILGGILFLAFSVWSTVNAVQEAMKS